MNRAPKHVAIIMDGNRRWARERELPIRNGHETGYLALKEIIKEAVREKIDIITVYAFSTENWGRPQEQVAELVLLMSNLINTEIDELHKNNVKLRILGDISAFSKKLQSKIRAGIQKTSNNRALVLNVALNYGGRNEIVRAISKLLRDKIPVNEENISEALDTEDLPDPDLIIRTGGAKRLSNFLLWQSCYSELHFTDTLWPDFSPQEFGAIIKEYIDRERRFGK